jgi:hypothetical protein
VHAAALSRLVDDAEHAGNPADRRREDEDDPERGQEAPQDVEVVAEGVQHRDPGYFVP